ncbi:MAG: putative RDD family membrane protein YckC, partial [Halobacteriales archaeon]
RAERYCPQCGETIERDGQSGDSSAGGQAPQEDPDQPLQGGRTPEAERREGGGNRSQSSDWQDTAGSDRGTRRAGQEWAGTGYPRKPDRDDTDVIGARIGAQIVDTIAMFAILIASSAVFGGFGSAAGGEPGSGLAGIGLLLGFVGMLFYGFFLEGYWDGYTVGKKLFGIKVVQEDGKPCDYGSAFVRNFLEIIDGLFYYLVGFVAMASSDKRQRVGDRLGGTVVVRDEP